MKKLFLIPFVCVYYSLRNFIWFRERRKIHINILDDLQKTVDVDEIKDLVTEGMLDLVGLRIVMNDCETIPRYVYLTKIQRRTIRLVSTYGYKVGLS